MYAVTVPYFDYNEQRKSTILHFHLSRPQAMENLHLFEDIDEIQEIMAAPDHELSTREKQLFVNLIRDVARISYGKRLGEDQFRQNDEVWQAFRDSAAYDAWFFALFSPSPEEAFKFIMKVIPKHLQDEIQDQLPKDETPEEPSSVQETVPASTLLESMSPEDQAKFLEWKNSQ